MVTELPGRPVQAGQVSDAALIEASLVDPGRFAAIFDRHSDVILRYACVRVGPDVAEDVTADTFLAAFRGRGRYDLSRADARPWLYGIAVRQIAGHRRAEVRQRRLLSVIPAELLTDDFGDRSAERVTAEQLGPRLAGVLAGLPRRDRELLLLTAWAELSYAESAEALGITVSAVRSRLTRIRARLRKALGGTNPAKLDGGTSHG